MVQSKTVKLLKVRVRGVVQGVGFRPFIYRLAQMHHLNGWVRNTSGNVEIEIEGSEASLNHFLNDFSTKAPPMARIEKVDFAFYLPQVYSGFQIRQSLSQEGKYQLVSPDIATCEDCQHEIFHHEDRRFGYPFTNCTNCGPRFTIIEDIPYDRPLTTMSQFKMCPACQREYDDPLDRRFHAQPNACPRCGPCLELVDSHGNPIEGEDRIKRASELIKTGKILALKGLGGFLLTCDATSSTVIKRLRERKKRPAKPLAVMVSTIKDVKKYCLVSKEERDLLRSPACPIVLLHWKRDSSGISAEVAPNLKYLGMMLPYTPLHHLLLREVGLPLVMTSGNISEEPIAKDNDEALCRLGSVADYFLEHNRDIFARYDDSVLMVEGTPQLIRRARGHAPYPIFLPFSSKQILACGAEDKNTFCLTKDNHAFLSQHIGDMENAETLDHFENTIELYKKPFRLEPEIIACDMHPEYLSTKYARRVCALTGLKLVPVQHHHAHIASCLTENGIEGPAIGVSLDGTGYGPDGTIWGGEFMLADWCRFIRMGHLEGVPMPGGAAAIKKPYRMALSYLYTLLGEDFPLEGLPFSHLDSVEFEIIRKQLKQKINTPLTSSAGRLFDAVSALAGIRQEIEYEAQAAIELEMIAPDDVNEEEAGEYPFTIAEKEEMKVVRLGELFAALVRDVKNRVPPPTISLKFHNTIAQIIVQMCKIIAEERGLTQVALSGGVFQNRRLLRLTKAMSKRENLKVLTHRLVPTNDGGISLGQAVVANFAKT